MNATQASPDFSPEDRLSALMHRRKALENLVRFGHGIESLAAAFQALLRNARGRSGGKKDRKLFHLLSNRVNSLPVKEVQTNLSNVDFKLLADIETILEVARTEIDDIAAKFSYLQPRGSDNIFAFLDNYLTDFKRRSRLSIALRIFLKEKQVETPPLELGFDPSELANELRNLKTKENSCRENMKKKMVQLRDETAEVLAIPNYPEALKEKLELIKNGLDKGINALENGETIENVMVEAVIISDENNNEPEQELEPIKPEGQTQQQAAVKESKAGEQGTQLPKQTEQSSVTKEAEQTTSQEPSDKVQDNTSKDQKPTLKINKAVPIPQVGFWETFLFWLKTPMGVSWEGAKRRLGIKKTKSANGVRKKSVKRMIKPKEILKIY